MLRFFARFGAHSFHSHGLKDFPGDEAVGHFLLHIHDSMPAFLPDWLKWVLIVALPVFLLGWLILKWQRWAQSGD